MDEETRLLHALRQSLAGEQKAAAMTVYPDSTPASAEARLSRVLSGELALPPRLLIYALRGPNPRVLLDCLESFVPHDPDAVREQIREELRELGERVSSVLSRLDDADAAELAAERRGPVRSRPRERRGVS